MAYQEKQNFDDKWKDENFSKKKDDQEKQENVVQEIVVDKDKENVDRILITENIIASEKPKIDENNIASEKPKIDENVNDGNRFAGDELSEQVEKLNLNENLPPVNPNDLDKQNLEDNSMNRNIDEPKRENLDENLNPIDTTDKDKQTFNERLSPINKNDENRQNLDEHLSPINKNDENRQNLDERWSPVNKNENRQNLDENVTKENFSEEQNLNKNVATTSKIDEDKQEFNENLSTIDKMGQEKQNLNENLNKINEPQNLNENFSQTYSTDKEKQALDENLTPIKETDKDKTNQNVSSDTQDYWNYCSHSVEDEPSTGNDKEIKTKFHKEKSHAKKMDALICNSYEMLHEYFDVKYQLPFDLFQSCTGIMFLRLWKGGFFLGGIGGTGLVMSHRNGTWSAPCAVSVGGLQIGFQVGIERVDDILLLHDDSALKLFIENGHFRLGFDASLAVGTFGRDSNMGVVMSEGGESKSIYSYSFAKGAFIGLSLDGGTLSIDNKINEEFYGRKASIQEIFYGNVTLPQQNDDLNKIQQLLNSFSSHKTGTKESTDLQNVSKPEVSLH